MKPIIAWFARNHVAANLMMGLIVLAGLVSLPQMPMKSFPDIDIPVINISVAYLGAAPEEVEEGVCVRIEEELEGSKASRRSARTPTRGSARYRWSSSRALMRAVHSTTSRTASIRS